MYACMYVCMFYGELCKGKRPLYKTIRRFKDVLKNNLEDFCYQKVW